jgi:hypothetical protein
MRLVFRSIAVFNVATALWLSVMFLILRHPGFELKAAIALAIALFCGFAVYSTGAGAAAGTRTAGLSGSIALGAAGTWAIYENLQPNAGFEGFILIIGAAWILEGAVAALMLAAPRHKVAA